MVRGRPRIRTPPPRPRDESQRHAIRRRRPHDVALRHQANQALRYKPVRFTGEQARAIARGFAIAAHFKAPVQPV